MTEARHWRDIRLHSLRLQGGEQEITEAAHGCSFRSKVQVREMWQEVQKSWRAEIPSGSR